MAREHAANRLIAIDHLRLIMAIMVIGIHTGFLVEQSTLGYFLTVNGLFRIAVPMFLLISGYYFSDTLSNGQFRAWIKRMLLLYATWSIVYAYPLLTDSSGHIQSLSIIVRGLIFGYWHLWFIPCAIGAGLTLYLAKDINPKILVFLALSAFMAGVAIQYASTYSLAHQTVFGRVFDFKDSHRNFLMIGFPFFCIGHLLRQHQVMPASTPRVRWALAAVGLAALLVESWLNHRYTRSLMGMDNLLSLMVACPALFMAVRSMRVTGRSKFVAQAAASIYFTHALFIEALTRNGWPDGTSLGLLTLLAAAAVTPIVVRLSRKWKYLL